MPTLGIVNVNTSASMTDTIVDAAQTVAAPDTTIIGITPTLGPASVETHVEAYLSATGVIDAVHRYTTEAKDNGQEHRENQLRSASAQPLDRLVVDAWILAGYGDLGKEALQELVDVPVVDITEAAAIAAMAVGDTYAVVTTLDRTVPMIRARLRHAGLLERCVAITAANLGVLELDANQRRTHEAITAQAKEVLNRHDSPAEAICLGCGGMAGQAPALAEALGVPVIDGVTAAVGLAESLVRQRLSTSRIGTFAPRRPKTLIGFEDLEVT